MFAELHSLAQAASLLISVAAEGDALRVTVNAAPAGKNGPAMHPLVLVGTPAELDAGFAEAIQIFEPSALPLLDQARAAANANGNKGAPALKAAPKADAKNSSAAAGNPPKRRPGRPSNAEKEAAEAAKKAGTAESEGAVEATDTSADSDTPDVDPRQMSLVDAEAAGSQESTEAATGERVPADQTADAQPTEPTSTDPRDTGLDLPI